MPHRTPEIVTAAELRAHLKIGKSAYEGLLRRGLPFLLVAGNERKHRRHDLHACFDWLAKESHIEPPRRGRPHPPRFLQPRNRGAIEDGYIVKIPVAGVPVEIAIKRVPNGRWFFNVRIGPEGAEYMLFGAPAKALCAQAAPDLQAFLEGFAAALKARPEAAGTA